MRKTPKEIISYFKKCGSVSKTATESGIHKTTVYRWLRRARSGWSNCLTENVRRKSTKPKTLKRKLSGEERCNIEKLRKERGFDSRKIVHMLSLKVSHMTVYRYLKRKGLVRQSKRYRRPKYQDTVHMHAKNVKSVGYLQMDVKYLTPELTGLPWTCFEYAIIDIFSRYKDAVILNQLDATGSMLALKEMLERAPFKPVFMQTDNGLEFQRIFDDFCRGKGIEHHFIHKRTPNENAVIERSFRTDEEEFFLVQKTRPKNYDELRNRFADYLYWYNNRRPHFGINLKTPMEIVANVVLH